ncbi:NYN domain-containing protein [Bacillus licheniformis]|uniref:NYN domain-containing protein n=1 Tax=Bacillus licheniformis TaxID=1402 RepID=UPI003F7BB25A
MKKVAIYTDYENLYKRLREYRIHPIYDLNFFKVINNFFIQHEMDIIKFVAFSNFEDSDFSVADQTEIHTFGVDVRHCSIDGKSSTDVELVIECMHDLYTIDQIDIFVIISNDRDYVPLLQKIKQKCKTVYTLSTKNGINNVVNVFSDFHLYIEDLFNITDNDTDNKEQDDSLDQKAREVAQLLYTSDLWKDFMEHGRLVGLKGYSVSLNRHVWKREPVEKIERYFQRAAELSYVKLVNKSGKTYFEKGEKYDLIINGKSGVETIK